MIKHTWITWFLLLSLLLSDQTVQSSPEAVTIFSNQAYLSYPGSLVFSIEAKSSQIITAIHLNYAVNGKKCVNSTAHQTVEFEAGESVEAEWAYPPESLGSLPPGAEIWWEWQIRTDTGETVTTERKTITIEDTQLTWKEVTSGPLEIYWSQGDSAFGQFLLAEAQHSLKRLSEEAGIEPLNQIRITVYPDTDQVAELSPYLPEWVGGLAFSDFNSIVVGIPPQEKEWGAEVIAHELAHLVTDSRVANCVGGHLPTWLSEGIAVFLEGEPTEKEMEEVAARLADNSFPALTSLTAGFPADSKKATQAYLQSGEVVRYMVMEYGADQFAALLEQFRLGNDSDASLRAVYGMDTRALDAAWRGLQPQTAAPSTTPTRAATAMVIPTIPLWTPVYSNPTATPPAQTAIPTRPAATLLPSETPADSPPAAQTGLPIWPFAAGGVGLIGLIILGLTLRRRPHP